MQIRHLDLDHSSANLRHDALPLPPVEYKVPHAFERPVISLLTVGVLGVFAGLMVHPMHRLFIGEHDQTGMAFVKQTLQAPDALDSSGAVHLAVAITTGVSGVSHLRMENVSKKLFLSLLLSGIVGALIGVFTLSPVASALL